MAADDEERPPWLRNLLSILWLICFPFILICEYLNTAASYCCFKCLSTTFGCCCGDMRYTDRWFRASPKSVGGKFQNDETVEWRRCSDIIQDSLSGDKTIKNKEGDIESQHHQVEAHLFDGGIEPSDIAQGQLGDCWLLSAISTLAEKKGQIEQIFQERSHSTWGKYHLRLFNGKDKKWQTITIDDYVPCTNGKPLFTQPKGNEMWVLLLEKAFAKLVGSYAELEGGLALWALEAMTGDIVSHFKFEQNKWQKSLLVHLEDKENKRKVGLRDVEGEKYSSDDFFAILKKYEGLDAALAAYSRGTSDKEATKGIVEGHAYSILNVKEAGGNKFLQLRNPWGTFSWEGDWSDGSPLWKQHPDVASALNFQVDTKDDGVFWMLFDDFIKHFDAIDVLDREVDIKDIAFTMDEDDGACYGPFKGCMVGCFRYWCLCAGCTHLCCPHRNSTETVKVNKCFCC